jgi:hypothetical protein
LTLEKFEDIKRVIRNIGGQTRSKKTQGQIKIHKTLPCEENRGCYKVWGEEFIEVL